MNISFFRKSIGVYTSLGKVLLILLVIGGLQTIRGQVTEFDPPTIVPPSPTAYELGKYGLENIGMYTGSPNTSIPIYNYVAGKLSVPITLNYNSNGIKVDQLESNVGLGWSLNAGGVITRIVRGKSDEHSQHLYPKEDIAEYGVWSKMAMDYFYQAGQGIVDTENDVYSFNFNGYSGKFIYTTEGFKILNIPHSDILIEPFGDINVGTGFTITDPSGIKYLFSETEINKNTITGGQHPDPEFNTTAWFLTKITHPDGDIIEFLYESEGYNYIVSQTQSLRIPTPYIQPTGCGTYTSKSAVESPILNNLLYVNTKKLVQIKSSNSINGSVNFSSTISHPQVSSYNLVSGIEVKDYNSKIIEKVQLEYQFTTNYRVFLQKVKFNDPSKNYILQYIDPDGLPGRLSFKTDHWGYYNGINNSKLYPNPSLMDNYTLVSEFRDFNQGADKTPNSIYAEKGLLKKIYYPTGGNSEFVYESNSYYGDQKVYPPSNTAYLSVNTDETTFNDEDTILITNILSDQDVQFNKSVNLNDYETGCDIDTYPSHHILATITVTNTTNPGSTTLYEKNGLGEIAVGTSINISPTDTKPNVFIKFKANNNYEVKIKIIKTCLQAGMSLTYFTGSIQTVKANINLGGLRVKNLINYDPVNLKTELKRFYYGKKETPTISTGVYGLTPFYISESETLTTCQPYMEFITKYKTLNSSSIRNLYTSGIGTTFYEYVTVSHGGDAFENGGEEHQYIINSDVPGNSIWGEYIQTAQWTNLGWDNGLEKKVAIFKKPGANFVVLKEIINNYKQDLRNYNEIDGYVIRKKFDEIYNMGTASHTCTATDVSRIYSYQQCITNHDHIFFMGWSGTICIANNHNNQTIQLTNPCSYVGQVVLYENSIRNLDVTQYKNISYWHYLETTIENQYDMNGLNPVTRTTNYFYDNDKHIQLTKKQIIDSDGHITETKIYYPDDVLNVNSLPGETLTVVEHNAINVLKSQNRKNIPIQTDNKDNGQLLSTRTIYKDWYPSANGGRIVEPQFIKTLKGVYHATTNPYQTRTTFYDYDTYGNPLEVGQSSGPHTSYLWGYGNQFPVAKVDNATYSQLTGTGIVLSTINSASTNDQTMRNELNKLRTLSNSFATTYTYAPLIGLTSETDPTGYTTFYDYDDFNRLKYIMNKDSKVLKSYAYNYKTDLPQYTVTSTTNGNGTVSLSATVVSQGGSVIVTVSPNSGYQISSIKVNGVTRSNSSPFTLTNITSNTVIDVQFTAATSTLTVTPSSITFEFIADPVTITVGASGSWTVSKSASWITISATSGSGNGSFNVNALKNTGPERTGTVTVTQGSTVKTIAILQIEGI